MSAGHIGQALANDVEGTLLFISGCNDLKGVIASQNMVIDPILFCSL